VAAFPSVIYTAMCLVIPERPRWLLGRQRDRAAGIRVLQPIQPEAPLTRIEAEADEILTIFPEKVETGRFWTVRLPLPILLAFLVAFFNQLSGTNAILYFAPRIFEMTGLGAFAPGFVFLFFCGIMVLQLVWVKTMVPETKGVPLGEVEHRRTGTPSLAALVEAAPDARAACEGRTA
jgi:hypothetical protein